ncbi:MAG: flagellar protein FhlB [Gammaproteobacteria bacterium RBG_16_57_12]|nr:MAG: flagellar protein FhlB [Gammaproteobacteria bacterium RBG_16_57_12]
MTNPSNSNEDIAVALRYDAPAAPRITAKGSGDLAREIMEIARQYDVPLYENAELAQLLSLLELTEQIPESLYVAVAEVLAFAYWLSGKTPESADTDA